MIIGKRGTMLKEIASAARLEMEELFGAKVNLQCWIKVKEDWRNRQGLLTGFGYKLPTKASGNWQILPSTVFRYLPPFWRMVMETSHPAISHYQSHERRTKDEAGQLLVCLCQNRPRGGLFAILRRGYLRKRRGCRIPRPVHGRSNRPMRLTTDALIIRENNNIG